MRTWLSWIVAGACGVGGVVSVGPVASAEMQQSPAGADRLSAADLEEMLAPIALYPDPLLANVLAASVYPQQLTAAKGMAGNDAAIDATDWEPSVKAVAKIPDALTMMTEYPDWTAALGEAFILQSQDVMAAVQRLRAKAQASGALKTTEQQVVQTQGDTIVIQPAQPQVIYVPQYNPQVVYVDNTTSSDVVAAGVIGFGLGVAAGAIIANNMDCDWHGGYCCYGCGWGYHGGYYHGGDYNGGGNTKIKIDTGGGDINIGSGNNNNIGNSVTGGNRPNISNTNVTNNTVGGAGSQWKPNQDKMSQSLRNGQAQNLNKYKGTGTTGVNNNARIPNRQAGSQPISQRPAPRPSTNQGMNAPSRPNAQATQRPSKMQPRGTGPSAGKPSIPPASQRPPAASRPATPSSSRPSAYGGGESGKSQRKAESRGASSRSSSAGGRSSHGGGRSSHSGGGRSGGGGGGGGGRGRR